MSNIIESIDDIFPNVLTLYEKYSCAAQRFLQIENYHTLWYCMITFNRYFHCHYATHFILKQLIA